VLRGRAFDRSDTARGPKVVIINEKMARQFWPKQDPVGRQLEIVGRARTTYNVIGVVQDTKWNALTESNRPLIYFPLAQTGRGEITFLLTTSSDPTSLAAPARAELAKIDSAAPVLSAITLSEYMETTVAEERNRAVLSSVFGGLGLTLAVVGIYGVVSYYLSQRTREMGIRMAIGAQPKQVIRMVLGRGLRMIGAGLAIGLVGALAATRLFVGLLYGVEAFDPLTLAVVSGLLALVALVATYLPARRAVKIDPCLALRQE
jgi:putative ABC transport system permease protein